MTATVLFNLLSVESRREQSWVQYCFLYILIAKSAFTLEPAH